MIPRRPLGLIAVAMLAMAFHPLRSAVVEMEYFIGADPGQGNGTTLSVSTTANSTSADTPEVSITNNLPPGTHNVGVRVKDSAGRWSNPLVRRVTIQAVNYTIPDASPSTSVQKLAAAEFFTGTDPGAGRGIAVGIAEEGFVASANSTTLLGSGAAPWTYSVGLRFQDQAGRWSNPIIRRLTIRPASEVANTIAGLPAVNTIPPEPATPQTYRIEPPEAISAGQLFSVTIGGVVVAIESRPFENRADFLARMALAINSDPAASLLAQATANGSTSVQVAAKENGAKASGWLQTSDTLVPTLVTQGTLGSEGRKIVAAEYFVGIDPNPGNGNAIPLGSPGLNVADFLEATVPISAYRAGNHRVGLRFKNAAGGWSNPLFKGFTSFSFDPVDKTAPVITLVGNATMQVGVGFPFSDPGASAADGVDGNLSANITVRGGVNTAIPGEYTITYLSQDRAGNRASAIRTVNVMETASPVFQGDPNIVHTVPPSTVDLFAGLVATHPRFGDLSHRVRLVSGSVDWFTPGTYNLQFQVGDPAGNTATLQRSITLGSNATFYPGYVTWIKGRGDLANADTLQRLAEADPDLDGRTNAEEWQADTDPFNRWSALESQFGPSGNAYLMKWSAMQRISYTIEESSNLISWAKMDAPMTFDSDSLVEAEIIPAASDLKKFYRLKASPKQPILELE